MKLSNRKPLFLALALTVAAPLAFAQSTSPQSSYPQSTTAPTSTTDAAQSAAQSTTQSTTQDATKAATDAAAQATGTQNDASMASQSSEPKKVNWSDLDSNKNGTLSASEAASVSTLAKAFGEADANADGELTQDEYKAYLAANGKATAPKSDSGG